MKTHRSNIFLHFLVSISLIASVVWLSECGPKSGQQEAVEEDYYARDQQAMPTESYSEPETEMEKEETLNDDTTEPEMNTEEYDRIHENPFVSTISNPVSTFSIDVDRAAYANVRRFLNQSQMPPPDAVRIEEMINYFDYDYEQPSAQHPFSTSLEMAQCPWNSGHYLMSIGLQGKDIEVEQVPASNLVFLLDVSGSMDQPNKLPLVKNAMHILMEKLRPRDRVAIVVYAGAAGMVLESTPCTPEGKDEIISAFENLTAGGSTAGGEGIELAYKIAKDHFITDGNNRVILATDGDFNVGTSSDGALERLIENKRDDGIFLTVLGVGMGNYKDSKMEKLSNAGNGNYAYIDNVLEARKTLGTEIWGTLFTIAKDVKIQIEFNPAQVKGYRLIGYENRMLNREDFDDDTKDAGEIGAGHSVTAIYEIIPSDSDEEIPGHTELEYQNTQLVPSENMLTLKLRYKQPDEDESTLIEHRIKASEIESSENVSQNFRWAAAVTQFGLLLRGSEYRANASYSSVLEMANSAKGNDPEGYRAEFIRLVKIAESLDH